MKLEDHVCSLELSKRLEELNLKQKSIFYWDWYSDTCYGLKYAPYSCPGLVRFSAFTASELMEILPDRIDTKINEPFNQFRFNMQRSIIVEKSLPEKTFLINYDCDTYHICDVPLCTRKLFQHNIWDKNLANAIAKVIICLINAELWLFAPESSVGD